MRSARNMVLKPYLEASRQSCDSLTKNELRAMGLALTREVPANGRAAFRQRFETLPRGMKARL